MKAVSITLPSTWTGFHRLSISCLSTIDRSVPEGKIQLDATLHYCFNNLTSMHKLVQGAHCFAMLEGNSSRGGGV